MLGEGQVKLELSSINFLVSVEPIIFLISGKI